MKRRTNPIGIPIAKPMYVLESIRASIDLSCLKKSIVIRNKERGVSPSVCPRKSRGRKSIARGVYLLITEVDNFFILWQVLVFIFWTVSSYRFWVIPVDVLAIVVPAFHGYSVCVILRGTSSSN